MCVTVLANLTKDHCEKEGIPLIEPLPQHCFFNLERQIIPYVKENWTWLTSMPPRVKNTWHSTLQKTLAKESDLFTVDPNDDNSFALVELDISSISPVHEAVKQIGKKVNGANNLATTLVDQSKIEKLAAAADEGPKTRGATKRKVVDPSTSSTVPKKAKSTADYSSARVGDQFVEIPFNKDGYRYHVTETDKNVYDKNATEEDDGTAKNLTIPSHLYRMAEVPAVTLSPNDRAYQLRLSDDHLSITGHEGYCVARATHSVVAGKWYFEVQFTKAPPDSAVRIGWAQQHAAVQACVGYNNFSYGWRSLKGTKFHSAKGKTYYRDGFKEGDTLGCLISLPYDPVNPGPDSTKYIPNCGKDLTLIKFKGNYFFEEHEEPSNALKRLETLEGSYIEFFHNGVSCGQAFTDIYRGFYFPAVSLYHQASLRMNFGPTFTHPPPEGVQGMCERVDQVAVELTVSDMIYLVDKHLYRENEQSAPSHP